ncbi:MAG: hydrogenase expression/formation protein [Chloroflexi bacterium]|nr:hydrogenase expression/formation protein [Chloroflexota bacterium]
MPLLPTGKLPPDLLAGLLALPRHPDPRVVIGPGIGRDAAVLDMGDHYLVAKTDPITFATEDIGWYTVNVNANDIACLGARPKWFMVTALLPAGRADAALAESIFSQIVQACDALDISLVGGHTEITYGLKRPLLVGAMLGEVAKDKLVVSGGARVGDVVLLTKAIPLEGTALIAREKGEELQARGFAEDFLARARGLLRDPGISVVREALIAADAGLATAMHDPTEGGLATGLWELAQAANVGLVIDEDAIPILDQGAKLCAGYGLDPMGTIASGSLLITTRAPEELQGLLQKAGVACAAIGRVVPREEGLILQRGTMRRPLPQFAADEITRLYSSCQAKVV